MDSSTLSHKQQMLLEAVRKMVRRGAVPSLDRLLVRRRPEEVVGLFPHLSEWEARNLLTMLVEHDLPFGAQVLCEVGEGLTTSYLEELSRERLIQVLSSVPPEDAATLLRLLPEDVATEVVPQLKAEQSQDVEELLAYQPETAGGLMSPDFFALKEECTVGEAIAALQRVGDSLAMVFYVYIVNDAEQLVGVLSLRSLLMKPPVTPLKEIMISDVLSVHVATDQEEVARTVARYHLVAIPVVDDFNKLIGIVTVDDVIDVIRDEATEDILKMAGASEETLELRSTWKSIRFRLPWVLGTLLAGLLASEIIRGYHPTLQTFILLTGFIPALVGLSGNVGNQSAAVLARSISMSGLDARVLARHLFRELRVGLFLALLAGGLLTAFVALRYPASGMVSLLVGGSVVVSMLAAVTFGVVGPFLLERLRLDPSLATGPLISTVVDVLGVGIYFSLVTYLLQFFPPGQSLP